PGVGLVDDYQPFGGDNWDPQYRNADGYHLNDAGIALMSSTVVAAVKSPFLGLTEPTGLTATPRTSATVQLTWNASPGADGYTVLRAPAAAGPYVPVGSSSTTGFL